MMSKRPTIDSADDDRLIAAQGGVTFLGFVRTLSAVYMNRGQIPPYTDDLLDAWLARGNEWLDAGISDASKHRETGDRGPRAGLCRNADLAE